MSRDFAALLAAERCWDAEVQDVYERTGEPAVDAILQDRRELVALCAFLEAHRVRSYLEIGCWTGRLVTALHGLFRFDLVAACDDGWPQRRLGLPRALPEGCRFIQAHSRSAVFKGWRAALGHVDLVLIDADHGEEAVRADVALQRASPHRFLALHDITGANRHTAGVRVAWEELRTAGWSLEIVAPGSGMGIGIWSARPPGDGSRSP